MCIRPEVLVVPVQFLSDHLEILYDLDVAAADEARAAGLRDRRIRMPNTRTGFIRALAAVASSARPGPERLTSLPMTGASPTPRA
jgi:protoheme ferro-lyase